MAARIKREDCNRTKHDSAFSNWKILIGPSDWEHYLLGKEGAEKYRTHNLPNCTYCTGVYELGIAIPRGQDNRKLHPSYILPVYLGQADNVRTRLQQYGRGGAHLDNACSNDKSTKCPGLFMPIFSKGFSIAYRWAPMKTKRDAERTEAQLLERFDYAWNKGNNGARRPNDILKTLDRRSRESRFSLTTRKLQYFHRKQEGVKIKHFKPYLLENRSNMDNASDSASIFSRIFKIGRSRPRLVPVKDGPSDDCRVICGITTSVGLICTNPPVKGRKRCLEHKGMRVNSKLIAEEKIPCVTPSTTSVSTDFHRSHPFEEPVNEKYFLICGVILDDGSPCRREPVRGNKRCLEHKGLRRSKQGEGLPSNFHSGRLTMWLR